MWIEAAKPLRVQFKHGREVRFRPGIAVELPDEDGRKLIERAAGKVRLADGSSQVSDSDQPTAPIQPGWLVVYRDEMGRLRGGSDERQAGTVAKCYWRRGAWNMQLTSGRELPLSAIRAVSKTDTRGRILAAWMVQDHGYDGEGMQV